MSAATAEAGTFAAPAWRALSHALTAPQAAMTAMPIQAQSSGMCRNTAKLIASAERLLTVPV